MSSNTNSRQQSQKNVLSPSRIEDGEDIAAHIPIAQDGGWGWVILICSFFCIFIIDGVAYTYGAFFSDISKEFNVADSLVALINSIQLALYFILSPVACAIISRYGFRTCTTSGAIIMCFSLISSYLAPCYVFLLIFYGIFGGLGCALINMAAGLIAGFYFKKLRPLALAITSVGSSAGISTMFPVNKFLVNLAGWRSTILLHSGLCGIIYFLAMTFKPLMAEGNEENPSSTRVPNISSGTFILRAVSNISIPTVTSIVLEEVREMFAEPGPSTTIQKTGMSRDASFEIIQDSRKLTKQQKIKTVQSTVINLKRQNGNSNLLERPKKRNFLSRLCHCGPHETETQSLYQEKIETLPLKSKVSITSDVQPSLKYHMAMADIHERHGTTSVGRLLTSMIDTTILKTCSFQLLCSCNFFAHLGTLVPYVYLGDRNESAGVDPKHCAFFVSVIGISNAIGKISLSVLSLKIEALKIYSVSIIIAGTSTIAFTLSYNLVYQYICSAIYGFFISSLGATKSIVLVSLYGLDKLTNSTGILLIFIGLGNLLSTPLAGLLKETFGYNTAFCASGIFLTIGGIFTIPIRTIAKKEHNTL